jgi:PIN domain nuclease of toxin-antitoxin system
MIEDPAVNYPLLMQRNGFADLEVSRAHTLAAGLLVCDHGDPFDRIIAAQALIEGMTIVTRDPVFAAFGCKTLW